MIVNFTKAFEVELHSVLDPFLKPLQKQLNFDLSKMTLGQVSVLLRNNIRAIQPLFQKHQLSYGDISNAINKVNEQKEAKHSGRYTKAGATQFRTLFLGTPSVFACLRRPQEEP